MTSQRQLDKLVISHFLGEKEKEILIKAKSDGALNAFVKYLKNRDMNHLRVLDVGTGGGYFIIEIKAEFPIIDCFATDITVDTLKIIKKDGIEFIGSTVFSLPFSDNSFDVIIFGDLLHHLVGKNRKMSVELVNKAFGEILRVAKNNSIFCILEECVSFKYQSILLFWLTYCFAKLNIESNFFYINNKLIISFLTYNELKKTILSNGIKIDYLSMSESKSWKMKILRIVARLRYYTIIGTVSSK